MFDAKAGEAVPVHIEAKTIVVDPQMYLLRNLGSVNNTIIHECVHWVRGIEMFAAMYGEHMDMQHMGVMKYYMPHMNL